MSRNATPKATPAADPTGRLTPPERSKGPNSPAWLARCLIGGLVALALALVFVRATLAAEYFAAWRFTEINPPFPWAVEVTTPTAPADVSNSCPFPCFQGVCGTTAIADFHATSDRNRLDLLVSEYPGDNSYDSCPAGGDVSAHTKFAVKFKCPGNVASPISVSVNFKVKGIASESYPPPSLNSRIGATLWVDAGLDDGIPPFAGLWYAAISQPLGASTGAFAAAPVSNALDGAFVGPAALIPLDGGTNEATRTFILRATASPHSTPGTGYVTMQFHSGLSGDPLQGISLPTGERVFNLPEGCTCDSPDAQIVGNCINCSPTPVRPTTWGKLKSLYR